MRQDETRHPKVSRYNPGSRTLPAMRRVPNWVWAVGFLALILGAAVGWASFSETGYASFRPGPVYEIADFVEGEQATELNGEALMLTVVPSYDVTVLEALWADLNPAVDLIELERVRNPAESDEDYAERQRNNMAVSKETAEYVALAILGYDVTVEGEGVTVDAILPETGAVGVLEVGDVVVAIDGIPVTQHLEAITEIYKNDIGDELELAVVRNIETDEEEELTLTVTLVESTVEPGRPMIGFGAGTYAWGFESPVDIEIDQGNIGGPSAGLMYTITLLDMLSDDDLLDGRKVAGTGSIDRNGGVGAIGGIKQKVIGAERDGADVVFVPEANWEKAQEADVDIELVKVTTIDDALEWLGADELISAAG